MQKWHRHGRDEHAISIDQRADGGNAPQPPVRPIKSGIVEGELEDFHCGGIGDHGRRLWDYDTLLVSILGERVRIGVVRSPPHRGRLKGERRRKVGEWKGSGNEGG